MASVRVIAAHDVVQRLHPRPPRTEQDERALIAGRIIDTTLSQCNHEVRIGRRPTTTALLASAADDYDRELHDADLPADPGERAATLAQIAGVLRAFRASPIYGLARPRSRWILINNEVGMFAQPDFWDGRRRIFEMKSYRPDPLPPDVATQVRCFQLAFPGFEALVIGFDRRQTPVGTTLVRVPEPSGTEVEATLRAAFATGRAEGVPKVVEYLGAPSASYTVVPEEGTL